MSFTAKLIEQAGRRGDRPALLSDSFSMTWRELHEVTMRTSSWLRANGVTPGTHVALLCGNRPAYMVAWLALANVGAVNVSVNTGLVGDGLRHALSDSGATVLLAEEALLARKQADLAPLLADLDLLRFVDEDDLFGRVTACPPDTPFAGLASDPSSIIYTSGTTGPPKGVLNAQSAFLACAAHMARGLEITADDRIMVVLPLFHANPQMYALASALQTGCSIALRPRFSASRFFEDARRFECTMFTYVGTLLAMLVNRHPDGVRDHALTRGVGGGCPREVWQAIESRFAITPHELYGMTEIGGWVTGNGVAAHRFDTCGRVREDMEVRIVDDQDRVQPAGTAGEIVVRPKQPFTILQGYWGNPAATSAAQRNLWFHTGDRGVFDADGYLRFLGRQHEIIRRGGENISPTDIETALLQHPEIEDAAVVPVADPVFGQEIKAVVVPRQSLPHDEIRWYLEGRVADYMLPRYVQFVKSIPRTETQKILRRQLVENEGGMVDLCPNQTRSAISTGETSDDRPAH